MENSMNETLLQKLEYFKNVYASFGFKYATKRLWPDPARIEYLEKKWGKKVQPSFDFDVYTHGKPVEEKLIVSFEKKWEVTIPKSLRDFLLHYGEVHFDVAFHYWIALPEKHKVANAQFDISLKELDRAEEARQACLYHGFEEEYYLPWKDTMGFMLVDNGDIIAINLKTKQIIALSHDGDEYNGVILGSSVNEYVSNLSQIGFVGKEIDELTAFLSEDKEGIDPCCINAKIFRQIMGVQKYNIS